MRDEADKIVKCLESFWQHVDKVAVLDTGSADGTLDVVRQFNRAWAEDHPGQSPELRIGQFEWCDDFAAARAAADELLGDVDWTCWVDADDTLHGAEHLRALAARAPDSLSAYGFGYDYARDELTGQSVCYLKRERLVRRGHGTWQGRVHENQALAGPIEWVDPALVEWRHHKTGEASLASSERNRKLLRSWVKAEPQNSRVLAYLGTEYAGSGEHREALKWFRRYLKLETQWPEERAQIHRKMAGCLFETGQIAEALELALQAMRVHPSWPDSYLTLAEAHYRLGEYEHAEYWAREVLRLGVPDTLLIINPLDYTFQPRLVLSGSLGEMGRLDEAIPVAQEALQLVPGDPRIVPALANWQARVHRQQVAAQLTGHARMLIAHDEQAKALHVLEHGAPYFVQDHPDVVALRSQVRERLMFATDPGLYAEHYIEGGSKPEDFHDDEVSARIAAQLPRVRFLLAGLAEQAGLAA